MLSPSRFLNILSMRSVIMNPPMMFVDAATTASVPSTIDIVVCFSPAPPASSIAAITLMAEMALVSDMSGVCSSGLTRRITSSPRNAARMKTKISAV